MIDCLLDLKKNQGNILNIYANPWFSRVWDHLYLQCGHTRMHWARPLSITCFMALGRSLSLRGPDSLFFVMGRLNQMDIMVPSNHYRGFPGGALVVKNLLVNAGDVKNARSIPGLGRSPGDGNDNPLQYSCLENPMDRGAWRATVHRVAQSQTRLKWLSTPNGTGNNMKIVLCCC